MQSTMEENKQFNKLPNAGKAIMLKFQKTGDRTGLFKDINENVATQNTSCSKVVRTAQYVGLLKKLFAMTDADLVPIQITDNEYQKYNKKLANNFDENQHESIVNMTLFNSLLNINDLSYLLLTSGRRINEILKSNVIFDDDKKAVRIVLSKKLKEVPTDIYLIAPYDQWKDTYMRLITGTDISNAAVYLNNRLKFVIPDNFYKRSSHLLRAIYCRYIHSFRNPEKKTLPQIIGRYLNHDTFSSAAHYQHVVFDDSMFDIWSIESDLKEMKVKELRSMAKERGLSGYSRMTKNSLIGILK